MKLFQGIAICTLWWFLIIGCILYTLVACYPSSASAGEVTSFFGTSESIVAVGPELDETTYLFDLGYTFYEHKHFDVEAYVEGLLQDELHGGLGLQVKFRYAFKIIPDLRVELALGGITFTGRDNIHGLADRPWHQTIGGKVFWKGFFLGAKHTSAWDAHAKDGDTGVNVGTAGYIWRW